MVILQNKVAELTFASDSAYADPYNEAELFVSFTAPDGSVRRVPAFWGGGNTWKVRYSSPLVGTHRYTTECAGEKNTGLNGISGSVDVAAYRGANPLYKHGAVIRQKDARQKDARQKGAMYLSHQDGTPFFYLADTWWMGLTTRLDWPSGFQRLTRDRVKKGFTAIQIVAGLYPDMQPFDKRGANEAGFPWDKSFHTINPAYFDAADKKIAWLADRGLVPCIVGSWGFFMQFAGKDVLMRHWRYLIARWAAYPVIWCLAGEANMSFYDAKISPEEHLKASRRDWNDIALFVRHNDPFNRAVTVHPTQNGHEQIDDESLLDLDMLQTGHGGPMSLAPTLRQMKAALSRKKLPVIDGEVCYEGICGSSGADIQRYMFLACVLMGACGHTYGANGIWQLNAPNEPYGPSPHGATWGDTPWTVASRLPGSAQIGMAKKFLCRYPWHRFEQHPEWVERPCSLEATDGNFAAGIPGELRIIFQPFFGGNFWGDVLIKALEPDVTYRALRFNPITGDVIPLGTVTPDADGCWRAPRLTAFQDWLTVLEKVQD